MRALVALILAGCRTGESGAPPKAIAMAFPRTGLAVVDSERVWCAEFLTDSAAPALESGAAGHDRLRWIGPSSDYVGVPGASGRVRRWHEYYDWGGLTTPTCRPGEDGGDLETEDGAARVGYNSPEYLVERHGVPVELLANVRAVATLAAIAAGTA